jgi:hypothetical protein
VPGEPPEAVAVLERAVRQRSEQQLAHVEHVAAAGIEEPAADAFLDRAAEHRLHEPARRRLTQRLEIHAHGSGVLPQRLDRVRRRLAGAHRRDHERRPRGREVQHQRRRGRIEQLGVVHAEHHRATAGPLEQRRRARAHQRQRFACGGVGRQQAGEGPERDRSRAARRQDPLDEHPSRAATAVTWRARRDLPTPAGPLTTRPLPPAAVRRAAMRSASALRPISGHARGSGKRARAVDGTRLP